MKVLYNTILAILKNAKKSRFLFCTLFSTIILTLSTFPQAGSFTSPVYGAQYTTEYNVNIRDGAGTDNDVAGLIPTGAVFDITSEEYDQEGNIWLGVEYNGVTGYILAELAVESTDQPDDEQDEEDDGIITADHDSGTASQPSWSGRVQSEEEFETQLAAFPESYRDSLRRIHAEYPNYTFSADYINMDFEKLVDAQIGKKVSAYYAASWKAMYDESFGYYENYDWDTGEWMNSEGDFTYASREIIAHFIDPRNFLDTRDIYMFMRQSYSPEQTIDDLRSIIAGSFLSQGYIPDDEENDQRLNGDYAAVLMEAAAISGSSPFVLAASILLEHGYSGTTPLISGYYEANDGTVYEGYYNFFDIGATGGDSDNVIQNGLEYAMDAGWNSRYLSIVDGAIWITDSYINNGQDTYYYKEYNVINGEEDLWHQFSTGVMTAYSSSAILRNTLSDNRYAALDFRIPVYENMPEEPVHEPDYNDNLNNYYFTDMQAAGLEPEFSMANRNYTMTVTDDTVLNIAVPQWAQYEGDSSYALHAGENIVSLDVRSQTGYLRTYKISITSSGDHTLTVRTFEGNRLKITDSDQESTETVSEEVYNGAVLPGDANGDGKVTSLDYIAIKNHIMDSVVISDEGRLRNADANSDGRITSMDYITIKNIIMSN